MSAAPALDGWLGEFFESFARHRPVSATFIGWHAGDSLLPDYSPAGVAALRADVEGLLAGLAVLPVEQPSAAQALDRRLAEGFLEIQRWELAEPRALLANPATYTGEAVFGVISLLRRPFAPLEGRVASAAARLGGVPALLAQGRANIAAAGPLPAAWLERGVAECDGALALLADGLPLLGEDAWAALSGPAARAAAAFAELRGFLAGCAAAPDDAPVGCGEHALALLLEQGHAIREGAGELERYAKHALEESAARLAEGAAALGEPDWRAALARLADIHPPAERYYARYGELWAACRELAVSQNLLTWPEAAIRYAPQPPWARAAAPQLYFLFYHSPAPYDELPETEYLVTPVEPDMPPEERLRRLRATNESVIKLNHVVHHGAVGHHIQNWHARRAESRVGRVAAVDCATRIAMLCGGTMAEGWACYATDLMDEAGFLTPLEQLAERHTRLRMAARALVDLQMQRGALTLGGAAALYEREVGMPAAAARAEATRNSMFPATALMYLFGTDAIHRLRGELARRPGFTLRAFHDRLLSLGSIPVTLAAESMLAE